MRFRTAFGVLFQVSVLLAASLAAGPLHDAARRGDVRTLEMALREGADANERDADGWTPMHLAARGDHHMAHGALLAYGGDVAAVGGKQRRTVLHVAAASGSSTIVMLLMSDHENIDPLATDATGATALDLAEKGGHQRVAHRIRQRIEGDKRRAAAEAARAREEAEARARLPKRAATPIECDVDEIVFGPLRSSHSEVSQAGIEALASLGPAAFPRASQWLCLPPILPDGISTAFPEDSGGLSPEIPDRIAAALVRVDAPRELARNRAALRDLLDELSTKTPSLRIRIIRRLGRIRDPESVDVLFACLREGFKKGGEELAVFPVDKVDYGPDSIVDMSTRVSGNYICTTVTRKVKRGWRVGVKPLDGHYANDYIDMAFEARRALARIGGDRVSARALAMCQDAPPALRRELIRLLAILGTEEIVPQLVAMTDEKLFVQAAVTAPADIGTERAHRHLVDLIEQSHPDEVIREHVFWTVHLRAPSALSAERLLESAGSTDQDIRRVALMALAQRQNPRVTRLLLRLLPTSRSGVRTMAAWIPEALGAMGDRAAVEPLSARLPAMIPGVPATEEVVHTLGVLVRCAARQALRRLRQQ